MARRVFYSFHYKPDAWRASMVRNMGLIEGNRPATDNDWEAVVRSGDASIKKWIDNQMVGRSVVAVLIGSETAGRKWIDYEITKAWNERKGLLGIYIHNLENSSGEQSRKGANPFKKFSVNNVSLDCVVKSYDSPYMTGKATYKYIFDNFQNWIEIAIKIREKYA